MPIYICVKPLRNVFFINYELCGDGCCDLPVDDWFDFEVGEEYDFEDGAGYSTGRSGRVLVSDEELSEHFVDVLNQAERT